METRKLAQPFKALTWDEHRCDEVEIVAVSRTKRHGVIWRTRNGGWAGSTVTLDTPENRKLIADYHAIREQRYLEEWAAAAAVPVEEAVFEAEET